MVLILLKCLLQKKQKVNAILRKESRNMRLSIECKTLFVSVLDAVMKLTAVGKYYSSCGLRNFNRSGESQKHAIKIITQMRNHA